jgi:hypothetical protein
MRHFLPVFVLLLAGFQVFGQNNFRSRQSGDWSNSNTWEEFNGTAWQNTANVPNESSGSISIEPFMTVTLSTAVTANQIIVQEDALLDVISGGALTLTEDTGDELEVFVGNGTTTFDGNAVFRSGAILENQGTISSIVTNLSISGEYRHNRNGGAIPAAGWALGSKLYITGVMNQAPTGFAISPYTLEWDCPAQSANLTLDGPLGGITQDLLITHTNEQRLTLNGAASVNINIGNDLVIGSFSHLALSNSGSTQLTVNGEVNNQGVLRFSYGGGTATLSVRNNIISPGDINGTGTIAFTGTSLQTASITGGTQGTLHYSFPTNAEVDLGISILGGSGNLTVGNNVTLYLGSVHASGALQNTTTGGNIRVAPGSRTYSSNLLLVYNGAAAQFLGDGHPQGTNTSLRVDNPAGVSLVSDLVITGTANLAAGSLTMNGHDITAMNTLFSGAGFHLIPDENASLTILGSGDFGRLPLAFGPQSFQSLIINRTGGLNEVELTSDVVIHEDLVLTNGTLVLEDNVLEIRKDIVAAAGEIATTTTSGIRIAGTGPLTDIPFSAVTNDLATLTQARSGLNLILGQEVRIHDQLELTAGTVDNTNGNITLVNGSTILRSGGALSGDVPALLSGVYHVTYQGSAKTTGAEMPDNSTPDYLGNLTISGGPVTLNKDIVINGNLLLTGGTFVIPSQDITMRGSTFVNNAGTFTHQSGTFFLQSNIVLSGAGTTTFDNINIAVASSLTTENVTATGNLFLAPGGNFVLNNTLTLSGADGQTVDLKNSAIDNLVINKSGGNVTLSSNLRIRNRLSLQSATTFASAGFLTLKADPADIFGGARVEPLPAGASITGNVTTEWHQAEFDPAGVSMYFGSSVTDAVVSGLQDDILVTGSFTNADTGPVTPSLFFYDESVAGITTNGWVAYPTTDDSAPLVAGTGYQAVVMENGPVTLDLRGTLNQGDVSIPVTYTDNGAPVSDGWNLVSNPFASPIGWDQLNGWDKSNVRGIIAVNAGGKYKYYNGTGAGQGTSLLLDGGAIAQHQAFWVQAQSTGSLVIGEQAKIDPGAITSPISPANQMVITLNDGTATDQTLLVVAPGATTGYDPGLDAPKFDNDGMDISTLASDGTPLAFNFLDPFGCGATVELQIADVATGNYTLSVNTIETFDVPYLVTLRDNFLDVDHNVNNNPNYPFSIDAGNTATFEGRFSVIFAADLDDLINESLSYSTDATICQGEIGTVTFATSQPGVTYRLEVNGTPYGSAQVGTGSTLFFDLDSEDLEESNTLRVLASPAACATPVYLTETKTITKNDLAVQILAAGGKLASNYTAGNTWYFGDLTNQISTANEITPAEEGTYILVVNSGVCTQTVNYEYVVTSTEADLEKGITAYPNPVIGNTLNIRLPGWSGEQVQAELVTMSGHVVSESRHSNGEFGLDITALPAGVYLVKVQAGKDLYVVRVIRR